MNPVFVPCSKNAEWRSLYLAAIYEKNGSAVPERISEAERAVVARGRELFYRGGSREERNALDGALHALHAFRTAWQRT
jgi:hypothetical protein